MYAHADPEARWDAKARYVETIRDALGKPVDAGIKTLVIALNVIGYRTTASCEGHLNWGVPGPWVDIAPKPTQKREALRTALAAIEKEIDALSEDDPESPVLEPLVAQRRILTKEIQRPTHLLARTLMTQLGTFYSTRFVPYDQMISLHLRFIDFRMQCHGTDVQHIAEPAEKRANLERYQAEMHAFAAFLATHDRKGV